MRSFWLAVLVSIALVSTATAGRARAQDLATCDNAFLSASSAVSEDGDYPGFGGPGAGGDAHGVLDPTPDLAACADGVTGALQHSQVVAAWFSALDATQRKKFMREAGKVGVVDRHGNAFDVAHFDEMARYFDEAMTRQGMSDAAKLRLLRMMAQDAGIAADNKAETHDVHGG